MQGRNKNSFQKLLPLLDGIKFPDRNSSDRGQHSQNRYPKSRIRGLPPRHRRTSQNRFNRRCFRQSILSLRTKLSRGVPHDKWVLPRDRPLSHPWKYAACTSEPSRYQQDFQWVDEGHLAGWQVTQPCTTSSLRVNNVLSSWIKAQFTC